MDRHLLVKVFVATLAALVVKDVLERAHSRS